MEAGHSCHLGKNQFVRESRTQTQKLCGKTKQMICHAERLINCAKKTKD